MKLTLKQRIIDRLEDVKLELGDVSIPYEELEQTWRYIESLENLIYDLIEE